MFYIWSEHEVISGGTTLICIQVLYYRSTYIATIFQYFAVQSLGRNILTFAGISYN